MKNFLKAFNILNEDEIDWALQVARIRTIKKNSFFIKEGQVCEEVAFVQSGFFRSYYHNAGGEETTYCFTFAGAFITAYSSFITQEKTTENICAMRDTEITSIPRKEIIKMEKLSRNWLQLGKLLAEQEFVKMEKRIFLLKENAEHRYKDLLNCHPDYLQQIPLHQLATYLGITQRHLSRIRRSIKN